MMIRGMLAAALLVGTAVTAVFVPAEPAHAQVARELWVKNDCPRPMRFIISHADAYRNWHTHGWWNFSANESAKALTWSGIRLTQLDNHDLYIYGETTDGSGQYWQGGDFHYEFSGNTYNMMKVPLSVVSGHLELRLTCPEAD